MTMMMCLMMMQPTSVSVPNDTMRVFLDVIRPFMFLRFGGVCVCVSAPASVCMPLCVSGSL